MDGSDRALVAGLARRSSVAWVRYGEPPHPHPVWYAWHDDAFALVVGGDEQPLDGVEDAATVLVDLRARSTRHAVATVEVDVHVVGAADAAWPALAEVLRAARLNAGDDVLERWAGGSRLLRLVPTALRVGPDDQPDDDRRARVPASSADTASRAARRRRPPATPPLTG